MDVVIRNQSTISINHSIDILRTIHTETYPATFRHHHSSGRCIHRNSPHIPILSEYPNLSIIGYLLIRSLRSIRHRLGISLPFCNVIVVVVESETPLSLQRAHHKAVTVHCRSTPTPAAARCRDSSSTSGGIPSFGKQSHSE